MADKAEKRIFVGGLARNVTSEELTEKFTRFGEVGQVEIKTRDSDLDGKTFAYVNLTADENGFKKCFTAYSNTKWKGGLLKLQFAKQSFISKLRQEQTEAMKKAEPREATPAVVLTSPALEEHNKKAIPGTQMDDEGTWVMGKYSRVLPVLHMKKPGSKKTVTLDPSKTLHALKRLKCDDDRSAENDNSLTWSLEDGDSEMTKRRKGEFPAWQAPPRQSIFRRLQGLADDPDAVSDTEMEVVPVGRPLTKQPVPPRGTTNKVYHSSDSDSSPDADEITTKASRSSDLQQKKDARSKVNKNVDKKAMQNTLLKKSPKVSPAQTPQVKGQSVVSTNDDHNEKSRKGQRKTGSKKSKPDESNSIAYDSSDSDGSVTKVNQSPPVSKDAKVQLKKTTPAKTKSAKFIHSRTPPFQGLSMLSSSDEDSTANNKGQRKTVSEHPRQGAGPNSSDSKGFASTDEIIAKRTSRSDQEKKDSLLQAKKSAKITQDSSAKKSPKRNPPETSPRQGPSAGETDRNVKSGQRKALSEKPTGSGSDDEACDSSDSPISQDLEKNLPKASDSSEVKKGPQFQFVKTTKLHGKCLKMSTKLSQARTPPFKGLAVLSPSPSDGDDEDPGGSEGDDDSWSKRMMGNNKSSVSSTDCKVTKTSSETEKTKTPGRKEGTKGGPQVTPDVPKKVKQKQTRAEDGLTAIQRSHRAHLENLAEVTLRESIITKSLREGPSSKRIKFSDSDSEGHAVTQEQLQERQEIKQTISLFEDSASEDGEDKESGHDFSIRPQFEGKKGRKLMELQSTIKDRRFHMDDRFAESDSEEDDDDDVKDAAPDKDSLEESLAVEKANNLSILEKVLGYVPRKRKQPVYQEMKRYVDPEKSKHLEVTPDSIQPRKVQRKQVDPLDDSEEDDTDGTGDSDEAAEETDEETSDDENVQDEESTRKKEVSDSSDSDDGDDESGDDDEDTAVDMMESGGGESGKLSQLFAGGATFSFFGTTAERESPEDKSEPPKDMSGKSEVTFGTSEVKLGTSEVTFGTSEVKFGASEIEPGMPEDKSETSDDESEAELGELSTVKRDQDDEEDYDDRDHQEKKATEPTVHRVSECKPSFMISRKDPRLQAAVHFFKRPPADEYEIIVSEFPEKRHKIMQMVREKHKRALRKERRVQTQHWKAKQQPGKKFKK